MTDVLLVTCADLPDGEPGHELLDAEFVRRGVDARWVCWDDPAVDWAAARLIAVRSTWDYVDRVGEFLDWSRRVEAATRLLNGTDVFAWNADKAYLAGLPGAVPTRPADDVAGLAAAVEAFGTAVVKPRTGAGGAGVLVVEDPADPRLGQEVDDHPELHNGTGPWVVQPLVTSVRTEGETSVFVIGGRAVAQVAKLPAEGEIRVHEHFGGVSRPVPLTEEASGAALAAMAAASEHLGRELDYGRVDLMRYDGRLLVSELELIEPGLYLDVTDAVAGPYADLVAAALG